jgi:hypothetical protein
MKMQLMLKILLFVISIGLLVTAPFWRSGIGELMVVMAPAFIGSSFSIFFIVLELSKSEEVAKKQR